MINLAFPRTAPGASRNVSLSSVTRMLGLPGTRARQPQLTTVSRDVTRPTRSVSLITRLVEVCPINWIQLIKSIHSCNKLAMLITVKCYIFIGRVCCVTEIGMIPQQLDRYRRGVMVIVVGNGHGDTSSNPGRDWLHFPWESYESKYSPSSYG